MTKLFDLFFDSYENQHSIVAIIQNPDQILNTFEFHEVGSEEAMRL